MSKGPRKGFKQSPDHIRKRVNSRRERLHITQNYTMPDQLKPGDIVYGKYIPQYKNSDYTKFIWQACNECGRTRWVIVGKGNQPISCTCIRCATAPGKRRNGKSLMFKDKQGYINVWVERDDFFYPMTKNKEWNRVGGYVKEHRLVMAKKIGRCLQSWEVVHHKNHIRDDNRLENLSLELVNSHHQMTILECKIRDLEKDNRKLREEIKKLTVSAK